ncbi:unnamed protein product [Zymoseptoria tritici ST99CH_3D7]|uniref:BTB domain-containing protein n=1 Tax=Zymoseptoria tritici (strain ST99CH_3D7) TaxID=1276538 RepID=A0A1X7S5B6_ZYMT9|nr:unnamed protein product [Zymoseptoria tritici ST99CH_3D7]
MPPKAESKKPVGIDMSEHFKQDALSDVTLKFGNREMKCHKIILVTRSEYFKKLCGPESRFAEANQPVIELKEDDPTALEALLRYIYTFEYIDDAEKRKDDWLFHLNYYVVGCKYGFVPQANAAYTVFRKIVRSIQTPEAICDAIITLRQFQEVCPGAAPNTVQTLIKDNLQPLLKLEKFRTHIHAHEDILWSLMEKLEPIKPPPAPKPALVQANIYRCTLPRCDYIIRSTTMSGNHLKCTTHNVFPTLLCSCLVPAEDSGLKIY